MKNNLRVAVLAVSTLFCAGSYAASDTIRIGVDATFPPFESIKADGSLEGFEIDLGNAICAEIKKTCKWVPYNFDGLIPGLKAHKLDAIFSSMGITEKRRKQVLYTDVVWTGFSSMLSRSSEGLLPTVDSLKGKTIGVQMGSMQEEFAQKRYGEHGVNIKIYQDQDSVYTDLLSGRIDASFQDMIQAQFGFINAYKKNGYSNQKVEDKLLPADTAIAVRKNDQKLAELLNKGLKLVHENGTYDQIQTKYFGDLKLYSE